jgi:cobalt/nickel transport system permease protein
MFDEEYFNLGYLDVLSYGDTVVHRFDPRAKLIATFLFIVTVISFPKYEIAGLFPFFLFPVLIFALGDIPVKFIMKKVLLVSSFAFFIGVFNPIIDREVVCSFLGIPVSGGWISFLSIMMKFLLTITSALLLIATTSFPGICYALQKLGMPEIFVSQLLFLYRYLFVLTQETMRIVRARDMRSFGNKGKGMKTFIQIAGTLFLRTVERSERIYRAMLSRGFTGKLHATRLYRFSGGDAAFLFLTAVMMYLFRAYDLVGAVGRFSMGAF